MYMFCIGKNYKFCSEHNFQGIVTILVQNNLLCKYIEGIYFFQVNTKYISSSAVKKISIFHECVARVKMQIFSPHEMKYIWYLPNKSKFSF